MSDHIPRQDVKLPPTIGEAKLMARIEELCVLHREYEKILTERIEQLAATNEELEAKLAKAVGQMQRVKDYRYDPNIGIELNRLEEALAELKQGA